MAPAGMRLGRQTHLVCQIIQIAKICHTALSLSTKQISSLPLYKAIWRCRRVDSLHAARKLVGSKRSVFLFCWLATTNDGRVYCLQYLTIIFLESSAMTLQHILLVLSIVAALVAATPLDDYVNKPDSNYKYEQVGEPFIGEGYKIYFVNMTSQRWLTGQSTRDRSSVT